MPKKKEEQKVDDYHYHEVVDRVFLAQELINDWLYDHPVVIKHKELKKKIDDAMILLGDAYSIAGNLRFKEEENEQRRKRVAGRIRNKYRHKRIARVGKSFQRALL